MRSIFYTEREKKIFQATLVGSAVNAVLMVLKFIAGIIGHSSAMIADAINSLSDFITDIITLIFVKLSSKPCDENHKYGHGKYETLASAIIAIAMIIIGTMMFMENAATVKEVIMNNKQLVRPAPIAMVVAIISIVSKEFLFQYTNKKGKKLNSSSLRAKAWDHRSDTLTSFAALIGISFAMFMGEKGMVMEPIAAAVVSILIIRIGVLLVLPAFKELLEESLPQDIQDEISSIILNTPDIQGINNLNTRSIGSKYAIEADILIDENATVKVAHDITKMVEDNLRDKYGEDTHVVIHVEPYKCVL
ncbi:cation diffusion facilitator family transporter [Porphyromonas pogonae]|uniref:cation diffusion facilitator family transporter n=1 Tax=Porphyromonas pogonae TaxID=867595 RepID=UPI002E7AA2A9|nr:cation diffusion facilitator family transporter [Porphyromonas pogonae]